MHDMVKAVASDRVALLDVWVSELLSDPVDAHELRRLAAVGFRVGIQATTQAAQIPAVDPRDMELLTPEQIVREFKCSRWSVKRAIATRELESWPPKGTKRNRKVRRATVKNWVGR